MSSGIEVLFSAPSAVLVCTSAVEASCVFFIEESMLSVVFIPSRFLLRNSSSGVCDLRITLRSVSPSLGSSEIPAGCLVKLFASLSSTMADTLASVMISHAMNISPLLMPWRGIHWPCFSLLISVVEREIFPMKSSFDTVSLSYTSSKISFDMLSLMVNMLSKFHSGFRLFFTTFDLNFSSP